MLHNLQKIKKNKNLTLSVPLGGKAPKVIYLGTVKTDLAGIVYKPTCASYQHVNVLNKETQHVAFAFVYYEDRDNSNYSFRGVVDIPFDQTFPSRLDRHNIQDLFDATNLLKFKLTSNSCVVFVRRNGKITIDFANGLTLSFSKKLNPAVSFRYMSHAFISRKTFQRIISLCATIPTRHGTFTDGVFWDEGSVYVVAESTMLCYKKYKHCTHYSFTKILKTKLDLNSNKNIIKIPRNVSMDYDSYHSLFSQLKAVVAMQINNFLVSYTDEGNRDKDELPYLVSANDMIIV
jgi:hypothetical protein